MRSPSQWTTLGLWGGLRSPLQPTQLTKDHSVWGHKQLHIDGSIVGAQCRKKHVESIYFDLSRCLIRTQPQWNLKLQNSEIAFLMKLMKSIQTKCVFGQSSYILVLHRNCMIGPDTCWEQKMSTPRWRTVQKYAEFLSTEKPGVVKCGETTKENPKDWFRRNMVT